ncbi:MAG: DUF4142 domain-containing protein [Williamsia sp.]|nr:DUF4142 domain-containing protein [Williamsia sp.]
MKKFSLIAMMVVAACSLQSCGSNNNDKSNEDSVDNARDLNKDNSSVEHDDSKFAVDAASGGMLEVALGQLAVQKSQNQRVKNFGSMMVTDHTKANNELKALAGNKNIVLPAALGDDAQKHVDEMSKKTGTDFDKAYIGMMVDDHKDDIDEFEKAADKAKDVDLKSFASTKLPTLRMHLDSAKAIHDAMK